MKIEFEIPDLLYRKFQAATVIKEENENEAVVRLLTDYLQQLFPGVPAKEVIAAPPVSPAPQRTVNSFTRKKSFVEWFRAQEYHGRPYNPVTISIYTGRIENALQSPVFKTIAVKNLFEIDDIQSFRKIRTEIEACSGFSDFDDASHGSFTAALNMYDRFLFIEAGIPEENYRYMKGQTLVHRWSYEEDELCCRRYFEIFVEKRVNMDLSYFANALHRELPDISVGSLQMKTQNIKQLCIQNRVPDTLSTKPLNQYSAQCEKAFLAIYGDYTKERI